MHDLASHDHHKADGKARGSSALRLGIVAALTSLYMFAELIGGWYADSLALLSDAGHMFVDASGLMLAAAMARIAMKPPSLTRTFGYRRAEVLGAFFNATILCGLVIFIAWESVHRFFVTPEVKGDIVLWIAAGGLVFNLVAGTILWRGSKGGHDLNMKGALLNVAGDALGSVGALIAGLLIKIFEWHIADPIAGITVAALIAFNAVRLLRETTSILLQSVPQRLNAQEVVEAVAAVDGVKSVHDIHIWTMAPGEETCTLHVVLKDANALARWDRILVEVNDVLRSRFQLDHNIIQPELNPDLHTEIKHV